MVVRWTNHHQPVLTCLKGRSQAPGDLCLTADSDMRLHPGYDSDLLEVHPRCMNILSENT